VSASAFFNRMLREARTEEYRRKVMLERILRQVEERKQEDERFAKEQERTVLNWFRDVAASTQKRES